MGRSPFTTYLNAPTSYVRDFDQAEMVEVAPHQYLSRLAIANICSLSASPSKPVPAGKARSRRTPGLASVLAD